MKKRIFWGINHKTLMDAELKMLVDMGYEVYSPKKIKDDASFRSGSINYEFDKTLSISQSDIDKLNQFDFYYGEYTKEIIDLLNKYFDAAIILLYSFEMTYNFAASYKGKLFLRVFGREGDLSYEGVTDHLAYDRKFKVTFIKLIKEIAPRVIKRYAPKLFKLFKAKKPKYKNIITKSLANRKNGFIFAPGYKSIIINETPFFADRSVYLPLSIPDYFFEAANTWTGGDKRIMFVCPSIKASEGYYEGFYNKFVQYFSDLPHLIAGDQHGIEFEDKNIQGLVERDKFNEWLKTCACMYYNSREKRHIHYHPLEAIIFGLPLVYLSGGLLEYFGGADQPGMAKTEIEARKKIERILSGDVDFINDIKSKQVKILNEFKYEYVKNTWEKNFNPLIQNKNNALFIKVKNR